MRISIIVATDLGGVIGRENQLPWHLPADLKHFKTTTLGKPIVMGRKTHESIGRPLPGRRNVVITRQVGYHAEGCDVVGSLGAALDLVAGCDEVMIIGGASIYREALPRTDRIYLTLIHDRFEGDVRFPEYDRERWREIDREDHEPAGKNRHRYSFITLEA